MLFDSFRRRIEYLCLSVRSLQTALHLRHAGGTLRWRGAGQLAEFRRDRTGGAFIRPAGGQRIRLTEGEPLLRKNLAGLAARISARPGIKDFSLSTNGTQLIRQAKTLRAAGVSRLNVTLDSLDALDTVLCDLVIANEEGFGPITINMIVMAGVTDAQIDDMVAFCIEHQFMLRQIEVMSVGEAGRATEMVSLGPVQKRLRQRFGLIDGIVCGAGPAGYLVSPDGRF